MPFPNKDTQFKKGQSGNPAGPRKRPHIEQMLRFIEEKDLGKVIVTVWARMAFGDKATKQKPDFQWFKLMIDHCNGRPPWNNDEPIDTDEVRDDVVALRDFFEKIVKARDAGDSKGVGGDAGKPKRVRRPRRAD